MSCHANIYPWEGGEGGGGVGLGLAISPWLAGVVYS